MNKRATKNGGACITMYVSYEERTALLAVAHHMGERGKITPTCLRLLFGEGGAIQHYVSSLSAAEREDYDLIRDGIQVQRARNEEEMALALAQAASGA